MVKLQFFDGMKEFGQDISYLINTLLVLIIYITGIGVSFLITKIIKKQLIDMTEKESYWENPDVRYNKENSLKQF